MVNVILWLGAILGVAVFSLCIIFWGGEKYQNNERLWTTITNCGLVVYVVCAYLILKPILLQYYNLGWRMAVGAEAVILIIFILLARAIRWLKSK